MKALSAAVCVGLAAWCSLGAMGFIGGASAEARVVLLPPWWLLPVLIVGVFAAIRLMRLSQSQLAPLFGSAVVIVPWLPVSLPPAALLWTGPFMVAIWIAVIVGTILIGGRPVRSRWLTDAHHAPLVAATLALALYGGSAWWLSPILPEGDAPHYLIIAQSLIKDGDLRIENNHQRGDYLEYSLHAAKPHYLRRGIDGAIYSIHAPGLPVLIAPAFLLFGYPGAVAFLGLVAALGTALVWHLAYRMTDSAGAAWFGWACCAVTTPFFFQATQIFPDGIAATCVLLGTLPLITGFTSREVPRKPDPTKIDETGSSLVRLHHQNGIWLLSGVSLAILPWLQTRLALIAASAALCACFRIQSVRQFTMFAAAPIVSAAAWFGYFYAVYGTANPTAPYGHYTQTAVANLSRGLPGLVFDQQFGLIPNAPVYGFILAGVIAGAARLRRWSWELLIVLVPYMIGVGMFQIWWGGTSAPARLLAPLALLLGVAAAGIWHDTRVPATKAMGLATLGASVLITTALVGPGRGQLLLNFRDGVALWLEWGNDLLDLPRGVPSLFRDTPSQACLKAALWGASFTAGWLALRAIGGRAGHQSGRAPLSLLSWLTTWCLAASLMIALSLAWWVDGVQPLTPETSQIGLLRHASPFRSLAYDYGERRFEASPRVLSRARVKTDRQRRPVRPAPLLSVSDVPAGTYQVHVTSSGPTEGTLALRIGGTPLPLWTASLSGAQSHSVGSPIGLPVDVRSLVVDGDGPARRTITAVELEPVGLDHFFDRGVVSPTGSAHRAARYGSVEAYFMDENAYPEPSGFWVAGERAAHILVASSGPRLHLFLRNAPVDNMVTIDVDGERHEIDLRPREETTIVLPRTNPAPYALLRIQTRYGFRPSQTDPASGDMRYLGCWVENR